MKNKSFDKTRVHLYTLLVMLGILVLTVLILSVFSRSTVTRSRTDGEYDTIDDVTVIRNDDNTCECRFKLDEIERAETLVFYVSHNEIQISVGGDVVYDLRAAEDDVFATVGGTWVSLPLYDSDAGKEISVVLTPMYKNYRTDVPEFLIGSEGAIARTMLDRAIPALVLSLYVVFVGFLLVCLSVYNSIKGMTVGRLYALGSMAISAGIWRISYDRVSYFLMPDKAVTIYTLSIISLMAVALSMLNSLDLGEKGRRFARIGSCVYCVIYIVQLVLQALGIADLRRTLKIIHITIIISAVAFVVSGILRKLAPDSKKHGDENFGWILGVGVVVDLCLYYIDIASFSMIFTLVSILCYTVIEGIDLLFRYVEQKNALEEMEVRLRLSRAGTMMSQIRSHFVFNLLNAISGLCKYDPEKADETVVRFARYLRSNIDIMENDKNIPFSTDLRQLEDYVALEQVRFGDKIEFYTDIETDAFLIPPLILQPVVENAIKHGIGKKQGNGTIILQTRDLGDRVIITVEDDGVGFDMSELDKESSVGLRNIRFRLEHLVNGRLDIKSEIGKGTTVTITIPREVK